MLSWPCLLVTTLKIEGRGGKMGKVEDFDVDLWLEEQKAKSRGEFDSGYYASRWGCSRGMVSRIRSGEKRMGLDTASKALKDMGLTLNDYYDTVYPRMRARYVRKKGMEESSGPSSCKRCGDSIGLHRDPNSSLTGGRCQAEGCTCPQYGVPYVERGGAPTTKRKREARNKIPPPALDMNPDKEVS
jgi:hypothetical protein